MPKRDRTDDPIVGATGFCDCSYHLPPGRVTPSDLWVTGHRAHHLAWLGPVTVAEWRALAEARRQAMDELDRLASRLRIRIHDLEDELSFQHDHYAVLEQSNLDLVGELAEARERHPAGRYRDSDG